MNTPKALILFRLLLVPCILALAYFGGDDVRWVIVILMFLGLISDILDGIIARKQGLSSSSFRRMDSQVDMLFWLSLGVSVWLLNPLIISNNATVIYIILGMEVSCYLISWIKFGRETCTHAFLSKMWGVSLLFAFTSLIGFSYTGIPFKIAIILGLISHIDRILITLILPKWTHDIPSSYHAYLIRKGIPFKRNVYLNG